MAKALTMKAIEAVKPDTVRREIPDGLMAGLYLVVQPTGRMSWAVRYRSAGIAKKLTIGPYPTIRLGDARELARKALVTVADGRDPSAEKKERRQQAVRSARVDRDTVDATVALFIERYAKANMRESSWKEAKRILEKNVAPAWKGRTIHNITKRDIVELLDAIVDEGTPVLANRVLAYVRRLMNWCVERDILQASPCTGVKAPTAEQSRDRVLSDDELRLLLPAIRADTWPFGSFWNVLLLTGQRRDEVANMRWREIDFAERLWVLPKERAKNNTVHAVPLSRQVIDILKALPRVPGKEDFVFTTTGKTPISGFSRAKVRVDEAILNSMKEAAGAAAGEVMPLPRWTLHDLRRTAASNMARLGTPVAVVEKILNHISGTLGGITAVYQRHDFANEKRLALEAWARFVEQIEVGQDKQNVVSLRGRS